MWCWLLLFAGVALGCDVVRFLNAQEDLPQWGVLEGTSAIVLEGSEGLSTQQFLSSAVRERAEALCLHQRSPIWETVVLSDTLLLSPITKESTIFTSTPNGPPSLIKSAQALGSPQHRVYYPPSISLLDLETDIGFIVSREVDPDHLPDIDFLFSGLVMTNTFVARDLQLIEGNVTRSHNLPHLTRIGPSVRLLGPQQRLSQVLPELTFSLKRRGSSLVTHTMESDVIGRLQSSLCAALLKGNLSVGDVLMVSAFFASPVSAMPSPLNALLNLVLDDMMYRSLLVWWEETFSSHYLRNGDLLQVSVLQGQGQDQDVLGQEEFLIQKDSAKNWEGLVPQRPAEDFLPRLLTLAAFWLAVGGSFGFLVLFIGLRCSRTKSKEE